MSKQFTSGQQRLPLLNIQNKNKIPNENVNQSKNMKGQSIHFIKLDINIEEETCIKKDYVITDNCNNDIAQYNKNLLIEEDVKHGDIEYTKNLQKALKDAIDVNDELRFALEKLTLEINELKKNQEEKDDALLDLAEFYKVLIYKLFRTV